MATKKVLVLNPLTGELQQLQTGDTVFGLANGDNVPSMISTAVSDETDARIAADTILQGNIDAEETRALAAEGVLQDNIDAEAAARLAADNTLQDNIDAEETRALAAEGVLQGNIDAEAATRLAADNTLQGNIDAEAATRLAADNTLQDNIDAEETRALAAEGALQTEIDSVETAVGLNTDGTLPTLTGTIIGSSTTIVGALGALQTAINQNGTDLQTEVDAIEAAVGLSASGAFVAPTETNYIDSATSVMGAAVLLDAAIKAEADRALAAEGVLASDISAEATARTNADNTLQDNIDAEATARTNADNTLQGNIDAEAAARLAADNTLQDNIDAEAAARLAADNTLQDNIDAEEARALAAEGVLQSNIDTKVSKAGDTMTGPLVLSGAPTSALQAATKGYVDSLAGGLSWQEPVVGIGATNPLTATTGDRFVNTTDGKIYTATATDTWNAGVAPSDGYAVFDKSTETGYVFSGTSWVQFTGTGQITAGLGLSKSGNTLNVDLVSGGALSFSPSVDGETQSAIALNTSAEFSQDGGSLALVDGSIANSKLANSDITINGTSVALGGSFTVEGSGAISVATVGSTSTVSVATATDAVKGVATFNTGSFTVTNGDVTLATVNSNVGEFGGSTAIPVLTIDAKGRVTAASTAAINTAASTINIDTTGLANGDAVYITAAGTLAKARADAAATVKVLGFVSEAGKVATAGVVGGFSGLTIGARYFLSDVTAGAVTSTATSTEGNFVAAVGIATSATTLAIQVGMPVQL